MTPAEHAATVREALGVREWASSITPSAYGEKVEREMPEAFASLDALVAQAERATELETALRRIANRYCLHSKGDVREESVCLDKPADQWCSVCIARAALGETAPTVRGTLTVDVDGNVKQSRIDK